MSKHNLLTAGSKEPAVASESERDHKVRNQPPLPQWLPGAHIHIGRQSSSLVSARVASHSQGEKANNWLRSHPILPSMKLKLNSKKNTSQNPCINLQICKKKHHKQWPQNTEPKNQMRPVTSFCSNWPVLKPHSSVPLSRSSSCPGLPTKRSKLVERRTAMASHDAHQRTPASRLQFSIWKKIAIKFI